LVSVSLFSENASETELLAPYQTQVFESAAVEPFLAIGIPRDSLEFAVSLEERTIRGRVILTKDVLIEGEQLKSGHEVLCFRSHRFLETELMDYLNKAGWSVVSHRTDQVHLAVVSKAGNS
jgi:hypothetical protein